MSGMRSFGYTIVNYFESENEQCAAVETAAHHVLRITQEIKIGDIIGLRMASG